ncbi:hypothetical protein NKH18_48835 [Streptomyces sp. M10(2022)]
MKDKLDRAQEAEWISTVHDRPIRTKDDIAAALRTPSPARWSSPISTVPRTQTERGSGRTPTNRS